MTNKRLTLQLTDHTLTSLAEFDADRRTEMTLYIASTKCGLDVHFGKPYMADSLPLSARTFLSSLGYFNEARELLVFEGVFVLCRTT